MWANPARCLLFSLEELLVETRGGEERILDLGESILPTLSSMAELQVQLTIMIVKILLWLFLIDIIPSYAAKLLQRALILKSYLR
jgi:hypothetical protein